MRFGLIKKHKLELNDARIENFRNTLSEIIEK